MKYMEYTECLEYMEYIEYMEHMKYTGRIKKWYILALILFQGSDFIFSGVFYNQNCVPKPSGHFNYTH